MPIGSGLKYFCGSALNFSRHPTAQKKYVLPSYSKEPAAVCGSTNIPQTGSLSRLFPVSVVNSRSFYMSVVLRFECGTRILRVFPGGTPVPPHPHGGVLRL